MIHNNKLFFCVLFLCALYNGLLGMEDAAVQTDNGFDKSKIEIPNRISFLHDQIIFTRKKNTDFNQTSDSLWALDYIMMLNIHKTQGFFHTLLTNFSDLNVHLVLNSDELVSKNTSINILMTAYSHAIHSFEVATFFIKFDRNLTTIFSSFTEKTFKEILLEALSYASLQFILICSWWAKYNFCALPDCQQPLREGVSASQFSWYPLTLFHCGHIIHSEHIEKLLQTDDPHQHAESFKCPECQAEVKFLFNDFIFIKQGNTN